MPEAGVTGAVMLAALLLGADRLLKRSVQRHQPPQSSGLRAYYFEGSLAAGRLPARSEVPVPPIGALPVMPLPIVGLLMLEEELVLVFMERVDGMVVACGMTLVAGGVLDDDEGIVVAEPVSSTF